MDRLQRIAIANGLLVVLAGMLAGFMLIFSLIGGWELWPGYIVSFSVYGTSEGWVRAHSGGAMNGILLVVIGLALPKMGLSEKRQRLMVYGFMAVAWGFTGFYWLGNAAGNRGLSFGTNQLGNSDIFGILGFLVGALPVFLVMYLLVIAAQGLLKDSN